MRELAGRLAELDPDAGAALQVIAYFDRLMEGRVGLEALVRGAAVLSGCPARLIDDRRGIRIRVEPDGRREDSGGPVDPTWPWVPLDASDAARPGAGPGPGIPGAGPATVSPGSLDAAQAPASPGTPDAAPPQASLDTPHATHPQAQLDTPDLARPSTPQTPAALWLETPGPPDGVRAMILERAAGAVRAVLERTRGWAPAAVSAPDPALVEVVLDASAPRATRMRAAAQLGLKQGQLVRALALYGGGAEIVTAGRPGNEARRAGVGPAVEPDGLPQSWAAARTALRLTAEGTAHDPGPRTVYADELGGLVLLADAVGPDTPPVPDELAVERAVAEAPWAAATLHAVSASPSLRAAAAELTVHHSTLQERLVQTEHVLGWDVHSPQGRLRLQLALAIRKLRRSARTGQAPEGARRSDVR
ncbi:helix-turn-helix domain-containing protein [Streptomyces sp. NBC_01356]|uniref:helix-turn-helix domain-containing protein n=1 Tax=Streptomyces sp. NBC_01356 TaxID=2903836 RepID=UPI002E322670|nr:helix-turn-helix domain-containing protein [Streptomyces sp. NBC_01356]